MTILPQNHKPFVLHIPFIHYYYYYYFFSLSNLSFSFFTLSPPKFKIFIEISKFQFYRKSDKNIDEMSISMNIYKKVIEKNNK